MITRIFFLFLCVLSVGMGALQADPTAPGERTLSIIKPRAVAENHIGDIVARFEKGGLHIAAIKMVQLTPVQVEQFYAAHKEKPFFKDLADSMTAGPIVVLVLEGPNAVARNRELMGATDPKKAAPGTIRADFARSITENAVHGSDSADSAGIEIPFFFKNDEIFSR